MREGAELAFSYANDKFQGACRAAGRSSARLTMPLDVQFDDQIDAAFGLLPAWGQLDIVVHAVAFAPREALAGSFTPPPPRGISSRPRRLELQLHRSRAGAQPLMAGRAAHS